MTKRRAFIKAIMTSAVATAFSANTFAVATNSNGQKIVKPRRLAAGNTVGLIAPSSNTWEDHEIHFAMDILRSFGFNVKPGKNLFQRYGYLAGQDKDRATDVNSMFADKVSMQ